MISMLPALAGCPDPQGRFDEFASKFPDGAALPDSAGGAVADINGTFLFALFVPATATLRPPQAIINVTFTPGASPKATFAIQFLNISTREPAGDTVTYPDIPINSDGTFTISIDTLVLVKESSDLNAQVTAKNVSLMGTIQDTDFFCGTVTGMVTAPAALDLAGSTFGAIRIEAGQTGSQLPSPPALDCSFQRPDAGMATVVDAGT